MEKYMITSFENNGGETMYWVERVDDLENTITKIATLDIVQLKDLYESIENCMF